MRAGAPGPHHAVALGLVAAAAGLDPAQAALAAAYGSGHRAGQRGGAAAGARPVPGARACWPAWPTTATSRRRPPTPPVRPRRDLPAASAPLLDISRRGPRDLGGTLFAA